jgi:hypothetical protein
MFLAVEIPYYVWPPVSVPDHTNSERALTRAVPMRGMFGCFDDYVSRHLYDLSVRFGVRGVTTAAALCFQRSAAKLFDNLERIAANRTDKTLARFSRTRMRSASQ